FSSSARRGFWKINPSGVQFLALHPCGFPEDVLRSIAEPARDSRVPSATNDTDDVLPAAAQAVESPEEKIEHALMELRESVARDLLEQIARASPGFFENLVLDLLHAMGYGTSRSDVQHVGGSGDGGIDG